MNNSDKILAVDILPLVCRHYGKTGNECGGILHVVLDDGNIQKHFIESSLIESKKVCDEDAILICEAMLKMSARQRFKLTQIKNQVS